MRMSKSRHTEAQIIAALKQVEADRTKEDVAREQVVSKHTIHAWKATLIPLAMWLKLRRGTRSAALCSLQPIACGPAIQATRLQRMNLRRRLSPTLAPNSKQRTY
jgi:hypothetical protein